MDWILKYWVEWVFGLIAAGVIFYVKRLAKKVNAKKEKDDAMAECMIFLMMCELKHQYNKYEEIGYCPMNEKSIFEKAYLAYHALGGNGPITALYNAVMEMPINPSGNSGYQSSIRG